MALTQDEINELFGANSDWYRWGYQDALEGKCKAPGGHAPGAAYTLGQRHGEAAAK